MISRAELDRTILRRDSLIRTYRERVEPTVRYFDQMDPEHRHHALNEFSGQNASRVRLIARVYARILPRVMAADLKASRYVVLDAIRDLTLGWAGTHDPKISVITSPGRLAVGQLADVRPEGQNSRADRHGFRRDKDGIPFHAGIDCHPNTMETALRDLVAGRYLIREKWGSPGHYRVAYRVGLDWVRLIVALDLLPGDEDHARGMIVRSFYRRGLTDDLFAEIAARAVGMTVPSTS